MGIHISGSVAFDRIMTFSGQFEDHLLPEKLHILNVSFLIDRVEEKRGGTAGNIAYNLALMKEKPIIYSAVGKDFDAYAALLRSLDLPLTGLVRLHDTFTACAYITTDLKGNQITGFSPAAMSTPCEPATFPAATAKDWGCVSPGNMADMCTFPRHYRRMGTPYIFDPGQQVIALTGPEILEALTGAEILVGNDYEIAMISKKTGCSLEELKARVNYVISTLGEHGSDIDSKDWNAPRHVPAAHIERVLDPTGSGDAYRAGLLKGLHNGLDLETCARLGTIAASFCVEQYGTQEHNFTKATFLKRYADTFGEAPTLKW